MRITRFEAENFKRLKAVEINPDDNTVVIKGRNAQGKSSVLDGIMAALAGRNGAKELVRPIRDGESKARVCVELDDLVVERKWTASGSTVTVSPKGSNARLNSPQAVLDKLIGALSFDPLEFAEAEPKKQVETLIDLIGREEFDQIALNRREAYEDRTEVNRDVKRFRNEVESRADAEEVEPVDVEVLFTKMEHARAKQALRDEWDQIDSEIARLRERQSQIIVEATKIPDVSETKDQLRDQIAKADEINRAAQRWIDRQAAEKALSDAERRSQGYTDRIESLDQQRADLIAKADLPVDGLTFDDEGVSYNGVPFVQASAAERLKVSVGMAMALNPELRVICIRDASLLDDDSKAALVAMAKEHDYQIWYEVVGKAGEIGVIIEDGEVEA